MKLILLLSISIILNASILDDYNLLQAKRSYTNNQLDDAKKYYQNCETKTSKINYNLGNISYKQKNYKDAIKYYKSITDSKLKYKTLHNLGNSYAKLDNIDDAIKSYEDALKIKEDKDTKFNLELLKKKQQDKKKKEEQNKDKENNKNQKKQEDQSKKNQKSKNDQDEQSKQENKSKDNKKEQSKNKSQQSQNRELSKIEEKKWDKMLNKREINTLMIPMKSKKDNNEQNIKPW